MNDFSFGVVFFPSFDIFYASLTSLYSVSFMS